MVNKFRYKCKLISCKNANRAALYILTALTISFVASSAKASD
jgi:hypothetical protein